MSHKVLICNLRHSSYEIEREIFERKGYQVFLEDFYQVEDWQDKYNDVNAILLDQFFLNNDIIKKLKHCKVISRYGMGLDNIDLEACKRKKIEVRHVSSYCESEVAEHLMMLFLTATRYFHLVSNKVKQGCWDITGNYPVKSIKDLKVGIWGFGKTGQAFFNCLKGFEPKEILICDHHLRSRKDWNKFVLRANPAVSREMPKNIKCVDKQSLFEDSNVITINLPLRKENYHILNESLLSLIKGEKILVNTSRGALVEQDALYKALTKTPAFIYATDVFEVEPPNKGNFKNPLLQLDNCIVSDHHAWFSESSLRRLKKITVENALKILEKK